MVPVANLGSAGVLGLGSGGRGGRGGDADGPHRLRFRLDLRLDALDGINFFLEDLDQRNL